MPPGDEAKQISCSICKEQIKSEFLEEDEDWVWKNAITRDDKVGRVSCFFLNPHPQHIQIYHATCHAEALTSTNNLAARLRSDLAAQSRSRSGTPSVPSVTPLARTTPPTPPSLLRQPSESPPESLFMGVKRKAEDTDDALESEARSTPPLKKIALSNEV